MKHVEHFIAGSRTGGGSAVIPLFDPSTGSRIGDVCSGTDVEVDRAVLSAKQAFAGWSSTGLQSRAEMMLNLREGVKAARRELTSIVVEELGKTLADAGAEVDRATEALAQAAAVGSWLGSRMSHSVSRDVDVHEVRYPVGVVGGISPFNFPVLIPVVQCAMAIACGNTVVLKPSESDP